MTESAISSEKLLSFHIIGRRNHYFSIIFYFFTGAVAEADLPPAGQQQEMTLFSGGLVQEASMEGAPEGIPEGILKGRVEGEQIRIAVSGGG